MTKAKGRPRREKRLVNIPVAREEPVPDSTEENTTEEVYFHDLGPEGTDRMVQRLRWGTWNQLVDFAITQQVYVDNQWQDVVRYDLHGGLHVDR